MRVTGIRVGECIHLAELRAQFSTRRLAKSAGFLLPRVGRRFALFQMLRLALADFAKRAGCTDTSRITPHRLRHTWASDMLRCGISLPALKELMGHKDIRMTLRYLKITQPDLQREFYRARHQALSLIASHPCPLLAPLPPIFPEYATHWQQHAICWKCTDASSQMTKPVDAFNVS